MLKRSIAAFLMAVALIPTTAGVAAASEIVDSDVVDKASCLFRSYVNEGGESGLDCLN